MVTCKIWLRHTSYWDVLLLYLSTDKPVIGWSNSSIDSIPQSREVFPLSEREPIKQRPMRPDLEERPPDDVPPDQTTHLPDSFVGTPSTAQNDTLTSVSPVSTLLDTPDTSFAEESRGDNFVPPDRLSLDLSSPFYTTTAQQSAEHKSPALPRDLPAWLLFSPAESLVSEEHCGKGCFENWLAVVVVLVMMMTMMMMMMIITIMAFSRRHFHRVALHPPGGPTALRPCPRTVWRCGERRSPKYPT